MKITLTGSLGNISKPLTKLLVQKGHTVTVISSNADRKKDIEALGATAAIGSVEDVPFLTSAFKGADLVYCMVPPNYHADASLDLDQYYTGIGRNYAKAIRKSGVQRVIHLSSIGAHMEKDSGLILSHRRIEALLKEIPGIALTHMRPTAFYYNLLAFIPLIKAQGQISSNYGADDRLPWVSPLDIAEAIADEIESQQEGHKVRYVASDDEPTCNEVAATLGAAIGRPDMKWNVISDEEMTQRLRGIGMSPSLVHGLVEMNASIHTGALSEYYFRHRPAVMGKVKIADYAKEFAAIYNQSK